MTFGAFAYGSSTFAGIPSRACPRPPSCNLIVMEQLGLSPGHLDLDKLSMLIDDIIKK